MSRTDKDRPYWIKGEDDPGNPIAHHYTCEYSPLGHWNRVACDYDDNNIPKRDRKCRRFPQLEMSYWYGHGPTKIDRHLYWNGPARAEERATLSSLIKDYRANGDVDHAELDHQQHRHDAAYLLW